MNPADFASMANAGIDTKQQHGGFSSFADMANARVSAADLRTHQEGVDKAKADAEIAAANEQNSFLGLAKETLKGIPEGFMAVRDEAQKTEKNLIDNLKNPGEIFGKVSKAFKDPELAALEKIKSSGEGLITDKGAAKKVADGINLTLGMIQGIFSAVTAANTIASKIPGLKEASEGANNIFSAVGFAASKPVGLVIDSIPESMMSAESKKILKQPIEDLTSTAAQFLLGGKVLEGIVHVTGNGEVITPEKATAIAENARQLVVKHMEDPNDIEFSRGQMYVSPKTGAYVPDGELPAIDWGKRPTNVKSDLPTIQVGEKEFNVTSKRPNGEMTIVPIREDAAPSASRTAGTAGSEDTTTRPKVTSVETPIENGNKTTTKTPISGMATAKISQDIQARVEQDLGNLPASHTMNMEKEANDAIQLYNDDPETFARAARGEIKPPNGLHAGTLFRAAEVIADQSGDLETLRDLAHSKMAKISQELGRGVKAFDSFNGQTGTVDLIREVEQHNDEALQRKAGIPAEKVYQKEVKEASSEMKTHVAKEVNVKSWSDFIETIKCNY